MTRTIRAYDYATSRPKRDSLLSKILVTIIAVGLLFLVIAICAPAREGLEKDFGRIGDLLLLVGITAIYCMALGLAGVIAYWLFPFYRRHAKATED